MASSTISKKAEKKLEADSETHALATAVVFERESSQICGHRLHFDKLMEELESNGRKTTLCPICQIPIEVICDGMVSSSERKQRDVQDKDATTIAAKIVSFKYRNHLYRLTVMRQPLMALPFPFSLCMWMWQLMRPYGNDDLEITAQERIAHVLRFDLTAGMKILHKGKVIYPNSKQSPRSISDQLLELCRNGGKPLVLGTRMTANQEKVVMVKWVSTMFYKMIRACLVGAISMLQGLIPQFFLNRRGRGGNAIDNHQD